MADIILNDVEISNLIQEQKEFPPNYETLFQTKDKKGHKEQEIILKNWSITNRNPGDIELGNIDCFML